MNSKYGKRYQLSAILSWLLVVACAVGCRRDRTAEFTPPLAKAQGALETALNEWVDGKPAGNITNTSPALFVTDNARKPGQVLKRFSILGETPSKSGRTFAVQLELDNPPETIRAEYIIVGIDPLWIFRREDYELLMHWDHHMPATETSGDDKANEPSK